MLQKMSELISVMPWLLAAIAIPGAVVYRQILEYSEVPSTTVTWTMGLVPLVFAMFVTLANAYLSFLRPWLHFWANKNMDGYKFTSGIPALGSIAVLLSSLLSPPSISIGVIMLVTYILDTGGLLCFAVILIQQLLSGKL